MEIHEFQVSKCSHHVHIPFSTCWSEDNMLAVATEKGVYVSDLTLSPFNKTAHLEMRRYFVKASNECPTRDCGVNTSDLLKRINRTKFAQAIQDFTMFPHIRSHCYVPAVKQVAWSPCIANAPHSALLTVLNDSGSLEIKWLKRGSWELLTSVSQVWLNYWKSNWVQVSPTREVKEILQILKERTNCIKITAFTWGSNYEDWHSLYTCNMVGQVAIWKILRKKKQEEELVTLLHIVQTDIGHITGIYYQKINDDKCLLLISSLDGRVQSIPIKFLNNQFTIGKSCLVWSDKDKIQLVPNGGVSVVWDNTAVFTVAKGGHVIVFHLSEEGHQLNTCIHDSEDSNLTGMFQISEDEVMFTTRNGNISLLSLGKGSHQFKPSVRSVQSSFRSVHYASYGFSLSTTKVIAAFVYSVCKLYDHLPLREPSQIIWCYFSGSNSSFKVIKRQHKSLREVWDTIETIRIETILSSKMMDIPSEKEFDVMDLFDLKKYLWFTHICLYVAPDQERKAEISRLNEEINILVISCNVFKRITNLLSTPNISDFDQRSLMVMNHWLEYILENLRTSFEGTRATATTLLDQLNEIQTQYKKEKCVICSSVIPRFTGYKTSVCSNGHTVPRCSMSLVQCDSLPYYKCPHCSVIAHPEAVSDTDNSCIRCDNLLKIDAYIFE